MSEDRSNVDAADLTRAYEQRSEQLYEARGALAEAVATVTTELNHCRSERDRAQVDADGLRAHADALQREIAKLRRYSEQLEREARDAHAAFAALQAKLVVVENMKVIRWSTRPRALVRRLRGRSR
jgi:uncharacterized coiled-coil DUF342 family protein